MKRKNIILILLLIVISIFLVQYWSKQEQVEKERLEQIEKEKTEQEELERIKEEKAKQEELERIKEEKAKQEELERIKEEKEKQEELKRIKEEKEKQEELKRIEKQKAKKPVEKKQPTSVTWHTDVNQAINISVQTGKPLFFFFTGSDWCGWCKRLVKEVFVKAEFKKWVSNSVVLVELDFPRRTKLPEATQKQNRELAQMFGVRGYPTGWFVTPEITSGKVNFNKLGSQGYVAGGPKAWITGANNILKNK